MFIYREEKRFDRKTGKELPAVLELVDEICDFTGISIRDEAEEYTAYHLDYDTQDPCYGSGKGEWEFCSKHGIEWHSFLNTRYVFALGSEVEMFEAAMKNDPDEYTTFASLCRENRVKTAQRLINEGKYTAQNFQDEPIMED